MTAPLLKVESVSKTFGRSRVLREAGLTLEPGEVRGLVGANGSGKSTLVKILAGYHRADPGSGPILVDGRELEPGSDAASSELRFVHQDLALIPTMTVAENLALEPTPGGALRRRRRGAEAKRVRELLAEHDLDLSAHAPVSSLSAVERAQIAIIRALGGPGADTRVLVLDEVTALLPPAEVGDLVRTIEARPDLGVIFVSHRIEEILEICDTLTVLRDGAVVAATATEGMRPERLVELITGQAPVAVRSDPLPPGAGAPALSVRNLRGGPLRGVDLDLAAGEIVGLAALDPNESSQVLRRIYGDPPGEFDLLELSGRAVAPPTSPAALCRLGAVLVTDRLESGIPGFTLTENLTMNAVSEFFRRGRLDRGAEREAAKAAIDRYEVVPREAELPLGAFSGGNQQKVMLAKAMRIAPRLMMLDDPTRGVDVGAKAVLHEIVREAAAGDGLGVLVASTEFEELVELCHRVVVLRDGVAVTVVAGGDLSVHNLIESCYLGGAVAPAGSGERTESDE